MARPYTPIPQRLWAKVDKSGDCWEWLGSVGLNGYGYITAHHSQQFLVHREAWKIANGPIPDGLCVLHRCDNRKCVRLEHLFLGTDADNVRNMWNKGRGYVVGGAKGEGHPGAKLTAAQVRQIRGASSGSLAMARQYKISYSQLKNIRRGTSWRCAL